MAGGLGGKRVWDERWVVWILTILRLLVSLVEEEKAT